MILIISRVNVVKMDEQDKVNFGLGLSGVVGILAIMLKILSKRISRSSCFGVNVEMGDTNQQVAELQRVVAELTQQNATLKAELQQQQTHSRRYSDGQLC